MQFGNSFQIFQITYLTLLTIQFSLASKLNEVVIRSINEIFDSSNNVIAKGPGNDSSNSNSNNNPWVNEGFIGANATQITNSLGKKIDTSTKLLLATKPSILSTSIKDFDHTFLTIKFSFIIGHSESAPSLQNDTTRSGKNSSDTTSLLPQSGKIVQVQTIMPKANSSTIPTPETPKPVNVKNPVMTPSQIPETPISNPQMVEGKPPSNPQFINFIPSSAQQVPVSPPIVYVPSSSFAVVPPPPINPMLAPLQVPQSPPPAILKLNADGSDGQQVIQIAIDPTTLPQTPQNPIIANNINNNPVQDNVQVQQVPDSTNYKVDPQQDTSLILQRSKRFLNSEEISQIHKIIEQKKGKDKESKGNKVSSKLKEIQQEIALAQDAAGALDAEEEAEGMSKPSAKGGKKLRYDTWRASMDKSNRPPGFYVTVNDKVIFDNWVGVWQSSEAPTVMGRWSTPKKKGIWNETQLLLQFDERPEKSIKISFEWEPMDPLAYIFLSNISVVTYGTNETVKDIQANYPQYRTDGNSLFGGKNITLYIVLKTPSQGTEQIIKMGDKPQIVEQSIVHSSADTSSGLAPNHTLQKDVPTPSSVQPGSTTPLNVENKTKGFYGMTTGLIVACATGALSLVIMIFLIYKKMQVKKRPNSVLAELNLM